MISILIRGLTSAPYHDCPICFSSIRPDQAIWSCSPSSPLIQNGQDKPSQYCWTSFHVKCIRSWADKSVKEVKEAWRARGEPDKEGDWRCPGCQAKRDVVPSGYWYSYFSNYYYYSKYLVLGVFVVPRPNQNNPVLVPLIHVETHALVCVKVGAVIHVLSNVILDLVRHVKSPHVQNVTVP